jgi:hypothetical protein
MGNNISYIHELEAVMACEQSDGYLKQWAQGKLDELSFQNDFKSLAFKSPGLLHKVRQRVI